jgi:hypothetical protein
MRLGTLGFLPLPLVSAVLANLFFVCGLVLLYRVLRARYPSAAGAGIALLAFSPSAYVFSMAYSEPLFLLLLALSFTAGGAVSKSLAAAGLALTRAAGLALLVPAAIAAWRGNWRVAVGLAGGVVVGIGLWSSFVWVLTGDPIAWLRASVGWSPDRGFAALALVIQHPDPVRVSRMAFSLLVLAAAALSVKRDLELGGFSFAETGMSMLAGTVYSAPRFALLGVSAYPELAARLKRRGAVVLLIVFAVAQAYFVLTVFSGTPAHEP